jgi:putative transcriptional regulator
MKKELINDLVASIKEAGQIHRGERQASREFTFDPEDVRAIREKLHKAPQVVAKVISQPVRRGTH